MIEMFYIVVCRECDPDLQLPLPFDSAADRGEWCAAHRDGAGHDSWWVRDVPRMKSHSVNHGGGPTR